jgi:hypothetical protein
MGRRSGPLCEGIVKEGMEAGREQRWNVLEIYFSGREQRVQKWMLSDSVFMLHHTISPADQHSCHQPNHNVVFLLRGTLPNSMSSLYPQPLRTISETCPFSYKIPDPRYFIISVHFLPSELTEPEACMLTNLYGHISLSISYVKLKRTLL